MTVRGFIRCGSLHRDLPDRFRVPQRPLGSFPGAVTRFVAPRELVGASLDWVGPLWHDSATLSWCFRLLDLREGAPRSGSTITCCSLATTSRDAGVAAR